MQKKYSAIFFAPDGEYVRDFYSDNKEEVLHNIENAGSKWVFYPIPFVATEKVIVETPEGLEYLHRNHIKTVQKLLRQDWGAGPGIRRMYTTQGLDIN